VHGVGDRQNLLKISGLPRDAAQMMGLHEIKTLRGLNASKWRSDLSSKSYLPAVDGLIMNCSSPIRPTSGQACRSGSQGCVYLGPASARPAPIFRALYPSLHNAASTPAPVGPQRPLIKSRSARSRDVGPCGTVREQCWFPSGSQ
jgi:hypothetical protein